ncbi:MAG: DNA/RNA helicase domain-containing protein [Thiolinea sp.]
MEYKVGERKYHSSDKRQTLGYALDLKHFHSASHHRVIIPVLIATNAKDTSIQLARGEANVAEVICTNGANLARIINQCESYFCGEKSLDYIAWLEAPYRPTPTIIEAAKALYANHDVRDISRSDADAVNLADTSKQLEDIITSSRLSGEKAICFVTGVPGAGKTLVGLNIATSHSNGDDDFACLYLVMGHW